MSKIKLKRSSEPNKVPGINQLSLGELAINTHDGKMFFKQDRGGNVNVRQVGPADETDNVYYVSVNGSNENDGKSIANAFATIDYALKNIPQKSTLFVKSGTHYLDNPVKIPEKTAIVGDSLRTVSIIPLNKKEDMFWVTTGTYLYQLTFKDHEAPGAVAAFPPDGSAGVIYQSPYVQNCTSLTTTGTGMRVDGSHARGLRSMVVDAYTQYNQGGIGIHHLNGGNTQLVSVFTICCDIAFLCESGGFCSITNSNSSFGNFGCVADGFSPTLYTGNVGKVIDARTVTVDGLVERPYIGNAIGFENDENYYRVFGATDIKIGRAVIIDPDFSNESSDIRNARETVINRIDTLQVELQTYLENNYPSLDYNQAKVFRDLEKILNDLSIDMVFDSNLNAIGIGKLWFTQQSLIVPNNKTITLDIYDFIKTKTLESLAGGTLGRIRLEQKFDIARDIITDGELTAPQYSIPAPTGIKAETLRAKQILENNREYIAEEAISYIEINYPDLEFPEGDFRRDFEYIITGIIHDTAYGGNNRVAATTQRTYYNPNSFVLSQAEKDAIFDALKYARTISQEILINALVPPLNSSSLTQDTSVNGTTPEQVDEIRQKFDVVVNIVGRGYFVNDYFEFEEPDFSNQPQNAQDIRQIIQEGKNKLQTDTIDFINENFSEFFYDEAKCRRDLGLIIDAVSFDAALGTNYNSITAGLSYQRANAKVVRSAQFIQTVNAIKYAKTEISNLPLSSLGQSRAEAGFDEIIDILENNTPDTLEYPEPDNADQNVINAKEQLQNNRDYVVSEIIGFIDENYSNFSYDSAKCERDLGLIIDAVLLDLALNTNYNSITAGLAYQRSSADYVQNNQSIQTIAGIEQAKKLIQDLEIGNFSRSRVDYLFSEVVNLIQNKQSDQIIYNSSANATVDEINAKEQLQRNKDFLGGQLVAYINLEYPGLSYDEQEYREFVNIALDAISFDVLYSGNYATTIATEYYFAEKRNNFSTQEQEALADAFAKIAVDAGLLVQEIEVDNVLFNEDEQSFDQGAASSAETSKVEGSFQIIADFIETGNTGDIPTQELPSFQGQPQELIDIYNLISNEKADIISQTIQYIDDTFDGFVYDSEKCARDVNFIIDGLIYDVLYGGNSASVRVAQSYFVGLDNQLANGQTGATIDAYKRLQEILQKIVLEETVINSDPNSDSQIFSGNAASETEADKISDLVQLTIDVLNQGTASNVPEKTFPDITWADSDLQDDFDILQNNRSEVINDTIFYINDTYVEFNYNQFKCTRDIGLILDAVSDDMMFGTNYKTVIAATSYYRASASKVVSDQLYETVQAIKFLKDETLEIISVDSTTEQDQYSAVSDNFDIIIDVLNDGESAAPTIVYPSPNNADQNRENAIEILQANKNFLQEEAIAFIAEQFPDLDYDSNTCREDVGYIVDAVSYDILYSGNTETNEAAAQYFDGGNLQIPVNTKQATIDTFKYVREVAEECITNTVVSALNDQTSQVVNRPAATDTEAEIVRDLFSIVVNLVAQGYTSEIRLDNSADVSPEIGDEAEFRQFSQISTSSHTFEWVGSGTNINTALPYQGGQPIAGNEIVERNFGQVFFTATDQNGDFSIGRELKINRNTGTITGDTFDRSLFAVLTPYILAIED